MDDQDVRKVVFDTLDGAINMWLSYNNLVQSAVKNGIVDKDELVEHFMFRLLKIGD